MENYWKIFRQHKEEYLQNPLATKLLKIQDENEEIERRIRAKEEEIIAKEKELKALHGNSSARYQNIYSMFVLFCLLHFSHLNKKIFFLQRTMTCVTGKCMFTAVYVCL